MLTYSSDREHPVEVPFLGVADQVVWGWALAGVLQLPPPQVCFTKQTKHAEFPMDLTAKHSVTRSGKEARSSLLASRHTAATPVYHLLWLVREGLALQPRLVWNSREASCLGHPSIWTITVQHVPLGSGTENAPCRSSEVLNWLITFLCQ